jgi:hypothetical protein
LSEKACEEMREMNNEIIARMPGYKLGLQQYVEDDEGKILISGKDLSLKPYNPNIEQWFEFYTFEDIDKWAAFFLDNLELFEKEAMKNAA